MSEIDDGYNNFFVRSDDGLTPLHIAAAWGQIAIVDMLLLSGADPEIRDMNGKTAKDYAYDEYHQDVLQLLDSYAPNQCDVLNRERASYNLTLGMKKSSDLCV